MGGFDRLGVAERELTTAVAVYGDSAEPSREVVTPEVHMDVPELLSRLADIEADIEAAERRLRECVRLLRGRRATWREIGDALQVSRQAAWERFRRL